MTKIASVVRLQVEDAAEATHHRSTSLDARSREAQEISEFFDEFAAVAGRWQRRSRTYHRLIQSVLHFIVPPGMSVLEIGCGQGVLLAALRPRRGVGIDVSRPMAERAAERHPELEFHCAAGET